MRQFLYTEREVVFVTAEVNRKNVLNNNFFADWMKIELCHINTRQTILRDGVNIKFLIQLSY